MHADALQTASLQDFSSLALEIAQAYQPPATGRHSSIADKESVHRFLTAISEGSYFCTACDLAGLSEVTVNSWLDRGKSGEEPFGRFLWAYKRASAVPEHEAQKRVQGASKGRPELWTADMTWLQRRHRQRWNTDGDEGVAKVIVQIGARDSDVTVNVLSPHPDPGESETR